MALPVIADIVDLGHEMFDGMRNMGANVAAFWPSETFESMTVRTSGRMVCQFGMMLISEHCGTHVDAPFHFDEHGLSIEQVPLTNLILPGYLCDFSSKRPREAVTIADFEAAERAHGVPIGPGMAVLSWTASERDWGKEGFFTERPYIPSDTAAWLVAKGITLFGTDLIGIDDPDEWWDPTHLAFLKGGVTMVQQLNNLDQLVGREFLFAALPLPMRHGTASPSRPVGLVFA